jgi:hypothetical protein
MIIVPWIKGSAPCRPTDQGLIISDGQVDDASPRLRCAQKPMLRLEGKSRENGASVASELQILPPEQKIVELSTDKNPLSFELLFEIGEYLFSSSIAQNFHHHTLNERKIIKEIKASLCQNLQILLRAIRPRRVHTGYSDTNQKPYCRHGTVANRNSADEYRLTQVNSTDVASAPATVELSS